MKKKVLYIFLINSLLALNSCSFDDIVSLFEKDGKGYFLDETESTSTSYIDYYFNGDKSKRNVEFIDNSSNTLSSGATRLNLTDSINDLEYYDYTMPTTGNVKGLVIPVDFSDYPIDTSTKTIDEDVISVSNYYYNSSYGKLDLSFDIMPWYRLSNISSYYENLTDKYYGERSGISAIIDEVLTALNNKGYDLSQYDSNNDGYIDSLHIIYSHPIDYEISDFWWAYQYYFFENKQYDGVAPYGYVFAGYNFMSDNKEITYKYNYVHETGHLLGLEDYYDSDLTKGYNKGGLGGADMMDENKGDHNPFSKIILGWIKNPILVELNQNSLISLKISNFSKSGDVIILCDDYDPTKGFYQDYFLIYLLDKNEYNNKTTPYSKSGIKVLRIHGSLTKENYGEETYDVFKYNNYESTYNLIDAINNNKSLIYSRREYVNSCASDNDLFYRNDSSRLSYYDSTSTMSSYSFIVNSLNDDEATITITKK